MLAVLVFVGSALSISFRLDQCFSTLGCSVEHDPVSGSQFNRGTRKAEVLNSLIINTTAKANDTIVTCNNCHLYRLLWP